MRFFRNRPEREPRRRGLIESKVKSGGKNPDAPAVKPNFVVHGQRPAASTRKGFQQPFKGPLPEVKVPGLHEQLRPIAKHGPRGSA